MSWAEFIKTASVVDLERELFKKHSKLTEEQSNSIRKAWRIHHGKAEASDLNPAILTPEWWDVNRQDKLL